MSTYSPSLRIELITTGDQAGVWGTTTNTNLGTLVESAIAGYTSVLVTSADQALTTLNGAVDQSRNQTLALTTSTTAAFNVYAPPAEKTYVIYNASSYVATIYNSTVIGNTTAAGTGVAIPAGKIMTVWSDGTNFAVQNSHIIGTVVGNVTGNVTGQLTGTIASATTATTQTFGTNTTQVATTEFVQAALQALHPVGSIYINAGVSTNPATLLGFGTWTAFGAGRVPVGLNASDTLFDTLEETGGSKDAIVVSHSHSASSNVSDPGHNHGVKRDQSVGTANVVNVSQGVSNFNPIPDATVPNTTGITVSTTVNAAGSSGTNANLQPYITVAMWKRTA